MTSSIGRDSPLGRVSPIGHNSPLGGNSPIGRVVVLLGAPGAGKGTQAQILSKRLGLAHVATGDLFRAAVRDETPLGTVAKAYMDRGELVPDAVTIKMLLERLSRPDAAAGILLDGFPRNTAQADALDKALAEAGGSVDIAPYIEVPESDLVARLGGRWICRAEGHPYHEQANPPLVAGVCDIDGSELYQRTDDQPATVQARLRQQLGALAEVVAYYRDRGLLKPVDGRRGIDGVSEDLFASIAAATGTQG